MRLLRDCYREGGTTSSSIPKVIVRAGQTLNGILRTLNADYAKIQEGLLSVLYQVLTGKSFELMLAVATVEGELKTFVTKLIKFNECSKQINESVPDKTAATRAMLFDVSFLMLCSIVQTYGSDVSLAYVALRTEKDFVISCVEYISSICKLLFPGCPRGRWRFVFRAMGARMHAGTEQVEVAAENAAERRSGESGRSIGADQLTRS